MKIYLFLWFLLLEDELGPLLSELYYLRATSEEEEEEREC